MLPFLGPIAGLSRLQFYQSRGSTIGAVHKFRRTTTDGPSFGWGRGWPSHLTGKKNKQHSQSNGATQGALKWLVPTWHFFSTPFQNQVLHCLGSPLCFVVFPLSDMAPYISSLRLAQKKAGAQFQGGLAVAPINTILGES